MSKYKPEEFVLFNSPLKEDDSIFTQEDLEELGWWYIEKDSCILVQAKQKDDVMIGMDGKSIIISDENLAKGKILKMFCQKLFSYLCDNNPMHKKFELSILDDKENSFLLYDSKENKNYSIYLIRTAMDINLVENQCIYFLINLEDEPDAVKEYLTWLFVISEWTKFREFFGYSPVVTEEEHVTRIDPDDDFTELLSKTWNEVRNSEEYKQLISNFR